MAAETAAAAAPTPAEPNAKVAASEGATDAGYTVKSHEATQSRTESTLARSSAQFHVHASMFTEFVSRQAGGELGASVSMSPTVDLGLVASLGSRVGARVTATLHPERAPGKRLQPFVQLRGVVHPVAGAVAVGGGAWAGASYQLGPGRVLAGPMAELYRGPPEYHSYAVLASAGYELDLLQMLVRVKEVDRERTVLVPVAPDAPAVFRGQLLDLEDAPLQGEVLLVRVDAPSEPVTLPARPGFETELPAGEYEALAKVPGFLVRGKTFRISSGETVIHDFTLRPAPANPSAALGPERITVNQKIQFATNEARILSESHGVLDEVADILLRNPGLHIRVEGHTDNVGTPEYNQALSERRARAVRDFLIERGVPGKRVKAQGFGQSRPVDTNDTEEGRARNRRVQFEITERRAKPQANR